MAKKEKATGRAAKGTTIAPDDCAEEELQAASVVTTGGELIEGLTTTVNAAIRQAIAGFLTPQSRPQPVTTAPERAADRAISLARTIFRAKDYKAGRKPYLRVVGRVAEILLNHRDHQTVSAGSVYLVFLSEIPDEIPAKYRQRPVRGQRISTTTDSGRKTINNRMKELRQMALIRSTATRGERQEDYVLTEDGQNLFEGWPELSEIPGLELQSPADTRGGSAG